MDLEEEELIQHLTSESSYHSMQFGDAKGRIVEPYVIKVPKSVGKLVRALRLRIVMKTENSNWPA